MKRIYVLCHPKTNTIRYVGATSYKHLNSRLKVHIAMAIKGATSKVAAWIRRLHEQGLHPTIQLLEGWTYAWEAAETRCIATYRQAGAKLLNMADGGMGPWGCKPSDATRSKRSVTLKARYANDPAQMAARQQFARDAARSPQSRAAASARMKRLWADPEFVARMRASTSERMKRTWTAEKSAKLQDARKKKAAQC